MSPAAAAAAIWLPRARRPRRAGPKSVPPPPLVEVPSEFIKPIEEVMKALTPLGQKEFKAELAKAALGDNTDELADVVSAWLRTSYLVREPGFWEALERLPDMRHESESLTLEQLAHRIGLS